MAFALLITLPAVIAIPILICLSIAIPAILTVIVVYGTGYQRTFCMGALFPTCTVLWTQGWFLLAILYDSGDAMEFTDLLESFDDIDPQYRVSTGVVWILAILIGSLSVGVRRLLERTE